jgi:hypothetical protein
MRKEECSVLRQVERAGNDERPQSSKSFAARYQVASESRQWRSLSEVVDEVLISVGRETVPQQPKRPSIPPRKLN